MGLKLQWYSSMFTLPNFPCKIYPVGKGLKGEGCLKSVYKTAIVWFSVKWRTSPSGTNSFSVCLCDLFSWYFNILNLVFSTGPCSPMRETVMISAWQKRGVSDWVDVVIKFLWSQRDMIKCVQEFHCQHHGCSAGISAQKDCSPLLTHPIICKGEKCPQLHNQPQQPFDFSTMFMYQMEDWRSWLRSWTVEKWCTLSAGSRIQTLACLNMSSSTGFVLHLTIVQLFVLFVVAVLELVE